MSCMKSWPLVDLHVHTTASDGKFSPTELVKKAWEGGIRHLAITDHDTVGGVEEALSAAREFHLEVIPGIEISTLEGHQEVHILGYYLDYRNPELVKFCEDIKNARETRAQKIVERLKQLGYPVTMDEVYRKSGPEVIGRPHIALALMDHGVVDSISDGFEKLLGYGKPAYVPRFKINAETALEVIDRVGGVPVLAHPGQGFPRNELTKLVNAGLKGIEVYHPDNTEEDRRYYFARAKELNLVITGGSDFHGHHEEDWTSFGSIRLDPEDLHKLRTLSRSILRD